MRKKNIWKQAKKEIVEYKEYDFITVEYKGYRGSVYKDNMFGMEFCNFSLYDKTGKEIMHATLDNEKKYTVESVLALVIWTLDNLNTPTHQHEDKGETK